MNIDKCRNLLLTIAKIGKQNSKVPLIQELFPFRHYFDGSGNIIENQLSENDGLWTRREILTRFLLLQAVLDQGPDIEGIRQFLKNVTNNLYEKEVRILHRPLDFFREVGISVDEILQNHTAIKNLRAPNWAIENHSTEAKYNLFMDNTNQVLGYAIYRWGVPLAVPYLLEKDLAKNNQQSAEPLVDFLERFDSSEKMSQEIKDHERYGLGKAIGDKAAHLFAKWYIQTFSLCRRNEVNWGKLSFEVPFDSNVGRVLFRTGFFLELASLSDLEGWNFVQKNAGKGGKHYLRVTNLRGKKVQSLDTTQDSGLHILNSIKRYFGSRKRSIEIQQLPNALLENSNYGIGDLDDGIIYIGTKFCKNHEVPLCENCPINILCEGFINKKELIDEYRT